MKIAILCEEPDINPQNTKLIDKILEPLDEEEIEIKVQYLGKETMSQSDLLLNDLILADRESFGNILKNGGIANE